MTQPVGTFCLVLHTHLPWLAHAGAWPVGEEWLHQAFTHSWLRVVRVLHELADEGYRELLTLGVSPTVAAMLDDPHCLRESHNVGRQLAAAGGGAGRPSGARRARRARVPGGRTVPDGPGRALATWRVTRP